MTALILDDKANYRHYLPDELGGDDKKYLPIMPGKHALESLLDRQCRLIFNMFPITRGDRAYGDFVRALRLVTDAPLCVVGEHGLFPHIITGKYQNEDVSFNGEEWVAPGVFVIPKDEDPEDQIESLRVLHDHSFPLVA